MYLKYRHKYHESTDSDTEYKAGYTNVLKIDLRWGTYKVRNEIETKRNETKSTKTKRNETKRNQRNETKPTKAKRNRLI